MERSKEYTQSHLLERQRTYWEQQQTAKTDNIPVKDPKGNNTFELSKRVGFALSKEETALVQQGMNSKNKVETNAILLAALSRALKNTFGLEQIRVLLEGHGREDYLEKTDISRTVGWFTSMYPFVLDCKKENVESVLLLQDSLTQVPDKGVGYGLLTYLSEEPLPQMEDAQVTFKQLQLPNPTQPLQITTPTPLLIKPTVHLVIRSTVTAWMLTRTYLEKANWR
jgi:hypothetical protein